MDFHSLCKYIERQKDKTFYFSFAKDSIERERAREKQLKNNTNNVRNRTVHFVRAVDKISSNSG